MRFILICLCSLLSLNSSAQKQTVKLYNSLAQERKDEVVSLSWNEIIATYPDLDPANFKVINAVSKAELPFQLEYKGTPQLQNLLVQVSIPAKGSLSLKLVKGKHKAFQAKTFARYVPERKDDFAWENDRIAFRMYGKALEKFPNEMAYGVDVWTKRTDSLIVNKWYKSETYHTDKGEGMDYYNVGHTLGAGDNAPYINDTIRFPKNYTKWKVLDNGPLRSTFQLSYDEWLASGRMVNVVKTISIDAGSQLSRTEAEYSWNDAKPLPVVVGIAKRPANGMISLNEKDGIMAYWEPTDPKNGTTGTGCIFTAPVKQMQVKQGSLLTETVLTKPSSIVYYNGAAWDRAGRITSAEVWIKYLNQKAEALKNPIEVSFVR
ncbi:protein of unknown function [Flavobacterium fluvii]|uniref:DUF4861 domain-containing protein n=1 Tax=Flavobacterium fluvii TaxID=468056 RepID=A0A1M5JWE6_9FLAO|nr:DUF4861 family protein [Flavobacterium fluvii]SHG44333.1 protein of unknown function [Flavobacterium fluvii]